MHFISQLYDLLNGADVYLFCCFTHDNPSEQMVNVWQCVTSYP